MKKKLTAQPTLIEDTDLQLAEIIPIRTETVLSQYPLHRLSKGTEPLQVCFTKTNQRGVVTTTWKVSPNPEYGEPGILAYKLDTLVVNRRIDDLRRDVPELLYVGTWEEIQELLGIRTRNLKALKNAFSQNAGALITAKLEYTGKDKTNRIIELRSTRYGVIFVGERLPDGTKADGVYIALNPAFREVLRHAITRPLDYEYLKALPPASQRLYELISYQIYAAVKHENPRARYLYSDLCQYAPLTRYYEWKQVKKQLYKIHQPHKKSGYIKAIEFEEVEDQEGKANWVMWYTPGRKARAEFKRFQAKKERAVSAAATRPELVKPKEGREGDTSEPTPAHAATVKKLMNFGVDGARARRLVEGDPEEAILWADAWPHQNQKGMENPPAVLIRFIETKRRPLPKGYQEATDREERRKQHKEQEQRRMASEFHFDYFAPLYRTRLKEELLTIEREHAEEYGSFKAHFEKHHERGVRMMTSEDLREGFTLQKAAEFFNELRPELGLRVTIFDEWNTTENRENADPLEWMKNNSEVIKDLLSRH